MRLIDADEIRWVDHYDSDGNLTKYKVAFSDEMPPTVDAVEVIRCKDCKHWQKSSINYNEYVCYWGGYVKQEDDFCSWGRKKEKEND